MKIGMTCSSSVSRGPRVPQCTAGLLYAAAALLIVPPVLAQQPPLPTEQEGEPLAPPQLVQSVEVSLPPGVAPPADGIEGMQKGSALILDLLRQRRRDPRDDLISLLATVEYEAPNEPKRPLTDGEVAAFCGLLAAAGAETTAKLIGNAIVYLARHPDQRKQLFEEPERIPHAIEELLRYDAPSQFQGRVALNEVTVHGVTIPKGARVALVTGAAGRDEREYPNPDTLDLQSTTTTGPP